MKSKYENYYGYNSNYHSLPYVNIDIDDDNRAISYTINKIELRYYYSIRRSERLLSNPNYLGFRNGPIPHISNYRGGNWDRYGRKNKNFSIGEHRSNITDLESLNDMLYDYNFIITYNRGRASWVRDDMSWYAERNQYSGIRGWKRTRKSRQWM